MNSIDWPQLSASIAASLAISMLLSILGWMIRKRWKSKAGAARILRDAKKIRRGKFIGGPLVNKEAIAALDNTVRGVPSWCTRFDILAEPDKVLQFALYAEDRVEHWQAWTTTGGEVVPNPNRIITVMSPAPPFSPPFFTANELRAAHDLPKLGDPFPGHEQFSGAYVVPSADDPDGIIVLKHPHRLTNEARDNLRRSVSEVFGGRTVVILEEGMEIEFITGMKNLEKSIVKMGTDMAPAFEKAASEMEAFGRAIGRNVHLGGKPGPDPRRYILPEPPEPPEPPELPEPPDIEDRYP